LVLPSRCEGFPNVILEAMACDTPVITTAWAGADEIITDGLNGIIVPIDDDARLASSLMTLLLNKDQARQMAVVAGRRLNRFAGSKISAEYAELFLARGRGPFASR